jgi:hypothetical protein
METIIIVGVIVVLAVVAWIKNSRMVTKKPVPVSLDTTHEGTGGSSGGGTDDTFIKPTDI